MASSSSTPLLSEEASISPSASATSGPTAHMATTTLKVDGMTCGACTSAVESAFRDVKGAGNVSVSLVMGRAVVHHNPALLSADTIADLIEDRGFEARVLTTDIPHKAQGQEEYEEEDSSLSITTLSVKGMTCGACTSAIESGLSEASGVSSITVSLLSERAVVEHDPSTIDPDRIAEIIEDRGFDATVLETKALTKNTSSTRTASKKQQLMSTTVAIEGMTCGSCTSSVESAVKDEPGLARFNISLLAERAIIGHNPSVLSTDRIVELIEGAGFDARVISTQIDESLLPRSLTSLSFSIYGMADAEAAIYLENKLSEMAGVSSANVKLSNSRATVVFNPSQIGIRGLVEGIENLGYNALLAESDDNNAQLESLSKTKEIQEWRKAFFVSLSFAVPVMLISMIIPMYLKPLDFGRIRIIRGLYLGDIACFLLTLPVQFGIGKRFYISAFKSLKHHSPTMDVLVILGTSTAFFFSILAIFISVVCTPHTRPNTVFDTSTMLITFITLGRWLENRAKGQTSQALSRLMSLAPSMATIYDDPVAVEKAAENWGVVENSKEKEAAPTVGNTGQKLIPTELIQVGDIVCLRPGDKVPADGLVIRGESYVDESMITGEAVPIHKTKNQQVMAGTVNGAGWVDFRVTRAGRDTQLSQIVKLVQDAQTSRAPIQRMADVVAGYFVPAIITLGLITFLGWMVLSHVLPNPPKVFLVDGNGGTFMVCLKLCISVIVFACPCALGLSTPTAVMVGTGVGAEHGILVKGGAALEAVTKIGHVVFDKTGTLTVGKMNVAETRIEQAWSSDDANRRLWWLVVGLAEMTSEHPIGRAIAAAARREIGISDEDPLTGQVAEFEAIVGRGISALVAPTNTSGTSQTSHRVLLGNSRYLRSKNVSIPESVDFDSQGPEDLPSTESASIKPDSLAGMTLIHVAINNDYAGTIGLQDMIKPTAKAAVAALHRMGLTTSLVTGDSHSTALAVANTVGIPSSSIFASVNPSEKQSLIASMQSGSKTVAMIGDGINDSPALATAAVGIALASGTDVAIEAADIVIMRPEDLLTVPESLCLARSIFSRIKLNLMWACLYNAIGLPFAMGLFLPFGGLSLHPMAAGGAMAASSVSVVVSSLLLKLWKRPGWLDTEKLEREAEHGKSDAERGQGRWRRWWRRNTTTSDRTTLIGQGAKFFSIVIAKVRGRLPERWRGRGGEEGYVPLQSMEPAV